MADRKIIIFVPQLCAFGGVERLIVSLSRFLHHRDLAHTVICFRDTINFAAYGADVYVLRAARNSFAEGFALRRYLEEACQCNEAEPLFFDLKSAFYAGLLRCPPFHLHLTDPPSMLPTDVSKLALSLRGRLPGVRTTSPGLLRAVRGEGVHWINKRGVRRARSVITMTNVIAREVENLYACEAKVIRPGVMIPEEGQGGGYGLVKQLHFLSISRLEASKRIDWILQALAKLEGSSPPFSSEYDWVLDVVGEGSQADCLRSFAETEFGAKVQFHGHASDERLEELFAQASLFLMPAVQGYGLPALEALARGIPVILHRQSGISEILNQRPWVEVIEEGPANLADAIRRMAGSISSSALLRRPKPAIPSASDWAQNIAKTCGWT